MVNDVIRMQQEAEQRVQQMRERSRLLVSGGIPEGGRSAETMAAGRPPARPSPIKSPGKSSPAAWPSGGRPPVGSSQAAESRSAEQPHRRGAHTFPFRPDKPVPQEEPKDCERESYLENRGKSGGLGGLFQDQEQLFLLMLAILLIKNGAQMEIIIALLYLAM